MVEDVRSSEWLTDLVADIQVLAGAAPYATRGELISMFSDLAARAPNVSTRAERLILERLFSDIVHNLTRLMNLDARRVLPASDQAVDPSMVFKSALGRLAVYDTRFSPVNSHVTRFYELLEREYAVVGLTSRAIASKLGVSVWYLNRLLRSTGQNVRSHLRAVRMRHAPAALLQTNDRIKSIAYHIGYSSQSQFIRHFHYTYEMSPTAYRARWRGTSAANEATPEQQIPLRSNRM